MHIPRLFGKLICMFVPSKKIRKKIRNLSKFKVESYSQEYEDLFLLDIFKGKTNGFYVDVGSFDPYAYSNTALLHKKGWKGINIDASSKSINEFNLHRPNDINLNIGVGGEEGTLDYYEFGDKNGLNTFDKEDANSVEEKFPGKEKLKQITKVKIMPLKKIFDLYLPKGQQIDLLDIDVEGLDFEVLKSNDWKKYKPNVILVEFVTKSLKEVFDHNIYKFLEKQGYILKIKTGLTGIFVTKDLN